MRQFSHLPLGCPHCGYRTTLTVAGWNPDAPVQSDYHCDGCKRSVTVELPGRVIWHLPLDDTAAAQRLRLVESGDRAFERARRNIKAVCDRAARTKHVVAQIKAWQATAPADPLLCGNDPAHRPLRPFDLDGTVILRCRDCDYRQFIVLESVEKPE